MDEDEDEDEVIDLPSDTLDRNTATSPEPVGLGSLHEFVVAAAPCSAHAWPDLGSHTICEFGAGDRLVGEPFSNGWLRVQLPESTWTSHVGWVALDPELRGGIHQDLLRWAGLRVTALFSEAVAIEWPEPPWYERGAKLLAVEWAWSQSWEQAHVPSEPDLEDCQADSVPGDCRHITIGGLPPGTPVKLRVLAYGEPSEAELPCSDRLLRSTWIDTATLPAEAGTVLEDTQASELPLTGAGMVCYPYVSEYHDAACQRRCGCRGCRFCGQWVFDGRAPRRFQCRRCGCHANEHELGNEDLAVEKADAPSPSFPSQPAEASTQLTLVQALALQSELVAAFMDEDFQETLHRAYTTAGSDPERQRAACQRACHGVQAAVIARYGFKASQRGVLCSRRALDSFGSDPDVAKNKALLEWLTDPTLQADCPLGTMPGSGSGTSSAAIPSNPETLPLERCLAMQRDLMSQYKTAAFQERLWKAWWAAGQNTRDQHKARQLVCFEVQSNVLPRYGFEASRKGVVASHIAVQQTVWSQEKEMNGGWLYWLADPALQLQKPWGPMHDEYGDSGPPPSWMDVLTMVPGPEVPLIKVRVLGGLTAENLCVVDIGSDDTVADLKRAICSRLGTPERQQRLVLGSRPLHDPEQIGEAVRGFALEQAGESGEDVLLDFVDVLLVRLAEDTERDQLIDALQAGKLRLIDCSEEDWSDRHVVLAAVQGGDSTALRFASPPLRSDRDFVIAVVRVAGNALRYAAPELLQDRTVVLAAVSSDGTLLGMAGEALQDDREVVLAAVWNCGCALAHASPDLQGDRHLVLTAVWKDGRALAHAAHPLRADREVCLTALQSHGLALEHVDPKLRKDREVVLTAVQSRGGALAFAHPRLRRDREVCLVAVKQAGMSLRFVDPELQNDFQVAMAAVREDKNAVQYVGDQLIQNPSFMCQAPW